MDGSPGLGLGCSRLLFDTCEVDAPTLMERKNKGVRKVPRVSLDLKLVEFSFVHIASIYLTILRPTVPVSSEQRKGCSSSRGENNNSNGSTTQ